MDRKDKVKRRRIFFVLPALLLSLIAGYAYAAYHHEGEIDSSHFLAAYPDKAGTKLDHCSLCHSGGSYESSSGSLVSLGSCQWCHYTYGYDGSGNIVDTLNDYGKDYLLNGRSEAAVQTIASIDSDGDGFTNAAEITANRFPGNAGDDPTKVVAPYRVLTKAQLEAMPQHTQFMLMNASRQTDNYSEYTGVPVATLLAEAGISQNATGITVYAPDGWSCYHPLNADPDPELYHVNGVYPASAYYYDAQADTALNPADGWCDYSAPSCAGRNNLDSIINPDGLKMILAIKREGEYLIPGVLNQDNKLDGEGPFRIVPPQKTPGPPDQSSRAANQEVTWPYNYDWDHNSGAATRTVTLIRVDPLPEGTTDFDIMEAGWNAVDEEEIVVYGAIGQAGYGEYNYYVPYFLVNDTAWTGLGLRNCSTTQTSHVLIQAYGFDGALTANLDKAIAPRGQTAFQIGQGVPLEGWMQVNSDQPLMGLSIQGTLGSGIPLFGTTLSTEISARLLVPHVAQSGMWNTLMYICNPNMTATEVTFLLLNTQGEVVRTVPDTISPKGLKVYPLIDLTLGNPQKGGSVEITASQGIVASALYVQGSGIIALPVEANPASSQ